MPIRMPNLLYIILWCALTNYYPLPATACTCQILTVCYSSLEREAAVTVEQQYPIRFAVRSLGWVSIAEEELSQERSSRAVNKCIVDLSSGKKDINDVVGRWGDVSTSPFLSTLVLCEVLYKSKYVITYAVICDYLFTVFYVQTSGGQQIESYLLYQR